MGWMLGWRSPVLEVVVAGRNLKRFPPDRRHSEKQFAQVEQRADLHKGLDIFYGYHRDRVSVGVVNK